MNVDTGRIVELEAVKSMSRAERLRHIPMNVEPSPAQLERGRVGRNDRCPCGSGKKFKRCHLFAPSMTVQP